MVLRAAMRALQAGEAAQQTQSGRSSCHGTGSSMIMPHQKMPRCFLQLTCASVVDCSLCWFPPEGVDGLVLSSRCYTGVPQFAMYR